MADIAICVSGGMKFLKSSVSSINKLREEHNISLFLHTWTNLDNLQSNSKKHITASEQLLFDTYGQFNPTYLVEDFSIKKAEFLALLSKYDKGSKSPQDHDKNFTGIVSMFYSIYRCNLLRTRQGFDLVIRMRYDSNILSVIPIDSMIGKNKLFIPSGNDWGGLNDQFAIAAPEIYNLYANCYNNISTILKYTRHHPETIMLAHTTCFLKPGQLERFPARITINK